MTESGGRPVTRQAPRSPAGQTTGPQTTGAQATESPTTAPSTTGGTGPGDGGVAGVLAPVARRFLGGELPVRLRAWDGSEAGPEHGPVLVLRSRQALRRLLWQPGELGLARAYVTGELDVEGDLTDGLRAVWQATRDRGAGSQPPPGARRPAARSRAAARTRPGAGPWAAGTWIAAAGAALRLGIPGPRPPAPATEARVTGRRHSRSRDQAVIAHHYDVPPAFYELILDSSMAYSCGLWPDDDLADDPASGLAGGLAGAQRAKLDVICRKLALAPGQRLLDVGCGWGSLAVHAAGQYGARVTAVTLAAEQAAYVRRRVARLGLDGQVTVLNQDYRDNAAGQYDAVASVEMGEHVGDREYPAFCALLRDRLRPGGRLLIQQMSRGARAPGGGAFIESYIAPDMHMRPLGQTVALIEGAGLEVVGVQGMRADYTRTIRAWLDRLEERYAEATALIGAESARVWRLYLAGGALAFEEGRMGVDQILAERPGQPGTGQPGTGQSGTRPSGTGPGRPR
jgi:cyclopropane-fatty-acyl-phospholipid synthase